MDPGMPGGYETKARAGQIKGLPTARVSRRLRFRDSALGPAAALIFSSAAPTFSAVAAAGEIEAYQIR